MLHLILGILKVTGIVLAILLGLILLGLLAFLLVPVRYKAAGKKTGGPPEGQICVSWLLHIIGVTADYEQKQLSVRLKLFGFTIKKFGGEQKGGHSEKKSRGKRKRQSSAKNSGEEQKRARSEKKTREEQKRAHSEEKSKEEQKRAHSEEKSKEEQKESRYKKDSEREKTSPQEETRENISQAKQTAPKKTIREKFISVREKLSGLFRQVSELVSGSKVRADELAEKKDEFFRKVQPFVSEGSRELYRRLVRYLIRLWKHYRPRKLWGWVRYGTGSPDVTGELTGVLYLLLPTAGEELELLPDFTDKIFEVDAGLKGHVRAMWIVWIALALLRDREARRLLRIVRGRSEDDHRRRKRK